MTDRTSTDAIRTIRARSDDDRPGFAAHQRYLDPPWDDAPVRPSPGRLAADVDPVEAMWDNVPV